jgi:predicted N-acetyltransferase YhbS
MRCIAHLFEYPEHRALVARWIYGEFWTTSNVHTPQSLERLLRQATIPDEIPMSILALDDGVPVGTVNLIENDDDNRAHLRPWLAALYVVPSHRGRGIGSLLVGELAKRASALGINTVYLGTDNPGFYEQLGAVVHEQVNERFAVMKLKCPCQTSRLNRGPSVK